MEGLDDKHKKNIIRKQIIIKNKGGGEGREI